MYHHLISLRPKELGVFITNIKILKKYNRLKRVKQYEKVFTRIFKNTCYPFSWKLYYDCEEKRKKMCQEELDNFLMNEKKVLFENSLKNYFG